MQRDLAALAEVTGRALPTLDDTARALAKARANTGGPLMRAIRKPILATTIAVAAVAAVLVCPVPYSRTVYDLKVTGAGGKVTVVRLPAKTAVEAARRAAAFRRAGSNDETRVAVEPRRERVWGSVYAMAKDKILHIDVALDGKSDAQIEAEVRDQLSAAGWVPGAIAVEQNGDEKTVKFEAEDGSRRIGVESTRIGDGPGGDLHVTVGDIDDTREPGMTDEQLRQKILRQLKDRGMEKADVIVDGKRIEIRAQRSVEAP